MSSTSQKHRLLVNQPLGRAELLQLPGIGTEYANAIRTNYSNPLALYEHFHCDHQSNPVSFANHMMENYGMRSNYAKALANFFHEWEANRMFQNNL